MAYVMTIQELGEWVLTGTLKDKLSGAGERDIYLLGSHGVRGKTADEWLNSKEVAWILNRQKERNRDCETAYDCPPRECDKPSEIDYDSHSLTPEIIVY